MRHTIFVKLLLVLLVGVPTYASADAESDKLQKEQDNNTKFLLAQILNKAKALQEVYGDFAPFAAGLFPDGEVKFVWLAKPGETVSDPVKAMSVLRSTLMAQAEAGRLLGSAVAYKFKASESAPLAINVETEYFSGFARLYSVDMVFDADKKVTYGSLREGEYKSVVFASSAEESKASGKPVKKN